MNKAILRTSQLASLALSISVLGWSDSSTGPVLVANLASGIYNSDTAVHAGYTKSYMHSGMGGSNQPMSTDVDVVVWLNSKTLHLYVNTTLTTNGTMSNINLYTSSLGDGLFNPFDTTRHYCLAIQHFPNAPKKGYYFGVYSYTNTPYIDNNANDPKNLRLESVLGFPLDNNASLKLTPDGQLQLVSNSVPGFILWVSDSPRKASDYYNLLQ